MAEDKTKRSYWHLLPPIVIGMEFINVLFRASLWWSLLLLPIFLLSCILSWQFYATGRETDKDTKIAWTLIAPMIIAAILLSKNIRDYAYLLLGILAVIGWWTVRTWLWTRREMKTFNRMVDFHRDKGQPT